MVLGHTGGAAQQLVSIGLADAVLTGKPMVTYWRLVIKAYTNFALEIQVLDFNSGQPNFAGQPACMLDRIGDLVYWMFLVADMPGLGLINNDMTSPFQGQILCNKQDPHGNLVEPFWTRAVGQALILETNFFIGGQCIDQMIGEFLFIWEELTGRPGKRLIEMTGNYVSINALQIASSQPRRLYVPLPFWFTMNSGLALPLVSLQFHSVRVTFRFRPYLQLIRLTAAAVDPDGLYAYDPTDVMDRPLFKGAFQGAIQPVSDLSPLRNDSMIAQLEVCYVYLDQRERSRFADGAFEQLMLEHQFNTTSYTQNVTMVKGYGNTQEQQLELNFNNPIVELFWVARMGNNELYRDTTGSGGAQLSTFNDWFNFSGPADNVTQVPIDPVSSISLRLNNSARWPLLEGRYFRLVQPWECHTNIPFDHIYCYSFALQPEDAQPSGSCNFSRIDSTRLNVVFDGRMWLGPSSSNGDDANTIVQFFVFATNWNVVRYKYGLGGRRFSS